MSAILKSMRTKYKDFKYNGKRQSRDGFASGMLGGLTTQNNFIGQLVKVPAKYYLEMRNGEEIISVMSFPYDPDGVSYQRPQPTNITYTLGGVIRETNTVRRHNITLSGQSGRAFRTAYTRSGSLFYAEGEDVFQEFDEFLKQYTEICASEFGLPMNMLSSDMVPDDINLRQSMGGSESIHLVLRCIDEDIHLKVEPSDFRWEKTSGNNRFDYRWICSFVGYDYATKYTNKFFRSLDFVDRQVSSAGGVIGLANNTLSNISNDYVGRVRKSIQKVGGTFNVLGDTIEASSGLLSNVVGVGSDFVSLSDDLSYAVEDFSDLKNVFAPATNAVQNAAENLLPDNTVIGQSASALKASKLSANVSSEPILRISDVSDDEYAAIQNRLTTIRNIMENFRGQIPRNFYNNRHVNVYEDNKLEIGGTFLGNESNYGLLSKGIPESSFIDEIGTNNYFVHYLQKNEDLISLSQKYLGDPNLWTTIMSVNKWSDARRDSSGNFAEIGSKVLIPVSTLDNSNPFGEKNDFVGVDIKMDFNDISFEDNDLSLVKDDDNMRQIIKNTLLTKSGELIGFNTFGLPELPQVSDLAYGAVIVRESLLKDPRIIDVTDVELTFEEDTLIIECNVLTKNSTKINIKTSL